MIVLHHRDGPAPCNGPAIGLIKDMELKERGLPADNVLKLDGTRPKRGDWMFCGSCGEPLFAWMLAK